MIYEPVIQNFKKNIKAIDKLLVIDEFILDSTIATLEERQAALQATGIENARLIGVNTIASLKNIRKSSSLKPYYSLVYNQSVVLLVSYFSSSLHDLFNLAVTDLYSESVPKSAKKKELKFTIDELQKLKLNLSENIGAVISEKHSISFQDMAGVSRAFREYLEIEIDRDRTVNNIIVMQACRHAIAHAEQIYDRKLIHQIRDCDDRDIQNNIVENEVIQFQPEDIKQGSKSMVEYLDNLKDRLIVAKGNA